LRNNDRKHKGKNEKEKRMKGEKQKTKRENRRQQADKLNETKISNERKKTIITDKNWETQRMI
jgi:hypothetical protein